MLWADWDECIQILISVYMQDSLDKSLMLIIKILTKTARKILTRPLASCWPPCASLVSWAASAELEPEAGSGVSNESRNVENYK